MCPQAAHTRLYHRPTSIKLSQEEQDVFFQPAANQPWVAAGAPRMSSGGIHPSGGQAGQGRSRGAVVTEAIKNAAMDERRRVRATVDGNVAVGAPTRAAGGGAADPAVAPCAQGEQRAPRPRHGDHFLPTPLPARRACNPPARGSQCDTPLPRQAPRPRRQSTTCPDCDDH